MKKILSALIVSTLVCTAVALSACGPNEKVFEKNGIKITATTGFVEKELLSVTIYLESVDKIITGLKETPGSAFPITKSLREYTEATLTANNLSSTPINLYSENGVVFEYFIYERTASDKDFKYLGVTKKSDQFFYLFNFASENKNFDKFEQQFMDWAKLIEVE